MKIVLDRTLCDSKGFSKGEMTLGDEDEELVLLKVELAPDEVERARRAVSACPKAALELVD